MTWMLFFLNIFSIFEVSSKAGMRQLDSLVCIEDSPSLDNVGYNSCDMNINGEQLVVEKLISNGDIVFDVGANIGDWSREALAHHPHIKIYAFEPIPTLVSQLRTHFAHKAMAIFECVLSDVVGAVSFHYYPQCSPVSGMYDRPALSYMPTEKLIVQAVSLDSFCEREGISYIDFLKIDTEGNEFKVLLGASGLLSEQAIDVIQFEYGGTYPDAGATLKQVWEFLSHKKYAIYRIAEDKLIHIKKWRDALENNLYSNYLAVAIAS